MDSKTKKLVATVALAGAVTVGTAGVAVAADGSTTPTDPSAQAAKHPRLRIKLRRAAVKVVTDTLGVSRRPADRPEGRSDPQRVRHLAGQGPADGRRRGDQRRHFRLDKVVADGKITQERADTIKSKVPARVDKVMNHHFGQHAAA